jgi:hypothetical protein
MNRLAPNHQDFLDLPLNMVVDIWEPIVHATALEQWLHNFKRRYLDLHLSDTAWNQFLHERH